MQLRLYTPILSVFLLMMIVAWLDANYPVGLPAQYMFTKPR